MADAVRLISIRRGYDPREFALVVFGGAGPLHGADARPRARRSRPCSCRRNPGITSALGCLLVDIRHDLSEMFLRPADERRRASSRPSSRAGGRGPRAARRRGRRPRTRCSSQRSIDMRYLGQWRSLSIQVDVAGRRPRRGRRALPRRARARVLLPPRRRAGRGLPAQRASRSAHDPRPELRPARARRRRCPSRSRRARSCFDDGRGGRDARLSTAPTSPAGATFEGPAVIEQLDSTTLVPPGREGRGRRVAESRIRDRGGRAMTETRATLDPVTFEVLKNAFVDHRRPDGGADPAHLPLVRHLLPRLLLARCATANGNTVMQGTPGHRRPRRHAPLHRQGGDRGLRRRHARRATCSPINDPYLGGTHFCDVRVDPADLRRRRADRASRSPTATGPTSAAASPARSTSTPREHFGEGMRIPPVRIWRPGRATCDDVVAHDRLQHARARGRRRRPPRPGRGDRAWPSARSCGWSSKYGADDRRRPRSREVQDYVERLTRQRVAELPDGTWETDDYLDFDPGERRGAGPGPGEDDDRRRPDRTTTSPARTRRSRTFLNSALRRRRSRASSPAPRCSSPTCR